MVVQERCCAFELQPSRERPTDDVIAAFLAETNMLPLCRHGDPGTLQCVGCLTRHLRGRHPPCGVDQRVLACSRETALLQLPGGTTRR